MVRTILAAAVLAAASSALGQSAAPQQQNPPPAQQPPPPPPPSSSSSTTVVNPPATSGPEAVVVERRPPPNPMATVAMDAGYGAIAGFLVGAGVALINEWDTWQRDLMVGTGAGILVGAAVGVAHAAYEQRDHQRARERARIASDGLDRTDRDPVVTARPVVRFAVSF